MHARVCVCVCAHVCACACVYMHVCVLFVVCCVHGVCMHVVGGREGEGALYGRAQFLIWFLLLLGDRLGRGGGGMGGGGVGRFCQYLYRDGEVIFIQTNMLTQHCCFVLLFFLW